MTTGAALQDGSIGDVVRVRNSDSGVTVSGAVQPDGSVQSRAGADAGSDRRADACASDRRAGGARRASRTFRVLQGARDSQLVGYGLVVGLQGSGDTLRNAPFTQQADSGECSNAWASTCTACELRNRNVAAVIVTTDLPAGVGRRLARRRHRLGARRRAVADGRNAAA